MTDARRKIVLPSCTITEVCDEGDQRGIKRTIPAGKNRTACSYFIRPVVDEESEHRFSFNLFPVVLDQHGVPWDIAAIYILSRLEGIALPNMTTYQSIAEDLGAFKAFLDEKNIDFTEFPQMKLKRPTYRYHGHLKRQMFAREIAPTTAKRRMGCVIKFYRWLMQEGVLALQNDPWQERDYYLDFKDARGASMTKKIATTDVSVKVPKQDDPFAGTIDDGGKLRPLPPAEQNWVMEALSHLGNAEMTLIHLFMLLTGARIQTALTLKVRHVQLELPENLREFRMVAGPGTGIDTKYDKSMSLHVPGKLYEILRIYSYSDRARCRRERAVCGDTEDQYLFLTQHGAPYYQSKSEAHVFDPDFQKRHQKRGQPVRQFLKDYLIPHIQKIHDPKFHYRVHDLRASFGMNLTDMQLKLVEEGRISLAQARTFVQKMMCHESAATTDLYLNHRKQMEMVYAAMDGYEAQVARWIDSSMDGLIHG
jgi:integrase